MPPLIQKWNFFSLRRITTSSHKYMAEVDGLRFIAIMSVMLFHIFYHVSYTDGIALSPSRFDFLVYPVVHGYRGVQLFFVISGFILGLPFAAQFLSGEPPVKLGRYYLRRVTRLEPPYVLALLLSYAAAIILHHRHAREPGFYASLPLRLVYGYVLVHHKPPSLNGVTWTLELEVQFYLLAPFLARVFRLPTLFRRSVIITSVGLATLLAHFVPVLQISVIGFLQFFLTGFFIADLYTTLPEADQQERRIFDFFGVACLAVMLLVPESTFMQTLLPWILGGLFTGAVRGARLTALLRRPVVSIIGGMCYSLYLIHNPIVSYFTDKTVSSGMILPQAYLRLAVIFLPITFAVGITFFVFIERPCMLPDWPRIFWQNLARTLSPASDSAKNHPVVGNK